MEISRRWQTVKNGMEIRQSKKKIVNNSDDYDSKLDHIGAYWMMSENNEVIKSTGL